ncbi:MAG: hypothetical protein JSV04_08310, partial [Candidatus Heimdallarchaeota archaeon]
MNSLFINLKPWIDLISERKEGVFTITRKVRTMNPRISLMFVYSIAVVVFTLIIFRQIVYIFTEKIVFEPFFFASLLISIAAILIRLIIIDPSKFSSVIQNSDIFDSYDGLAPNRFLNLMPIAMIICTLSDFLLSIDFVFGMLGFL